MPCISSFCKLNDVRKSGVCRNCHYESHAQEIQGQKDRRAVLLCGASKQQRSVERAQEEYKKIDLTLVCADGSKVEIPGAARNGCAP